MDSSIFKGLKVIEIASVLAGPAVGMFFAELGAEVIKIENPKTNGDVTRSWKAKGENAKNAAYFYSINYNKQHLFLDLTIEDDRNSLYNLVKDADILISNFNDKTSEKLQVDYKSISQINQGIIYANLYSFKSDQNRPAYDVILQAESGFLNMSGISNDKLAKMPVALIDILAAHQLKEAILLAYINKLKTAKGAFVSSSLEETAISSLANQATNFLMLGNEPQPIGTLHPNICPYGDILTTKDEIKIVLAIGSNKQFRALCKILNLNDLTDDARFSTNESRVNNRPILIAKLQGKIENIIFSDFEQMAHAHKIPFGQIKNLSEVFDSNTGKSMILETETEDNRKAKRVKTIAFNIIFND